MAILPDTYQWVEYIQSSGECRIDTGFSPSGSYLKTEIKLNFNSLSYSGGNTPFIYGFVTSNYCFLCRNANTGNFEYGNGNSPSVTGLTVATQTDYTISIEANNGTQSIDINGNSYTSSCGNSLNTGNIQLWCRQEGTNSYSYYATDLKIYYFKIYTAANTLVRDFIPCYRKADGVIGLYDVVNNQFYTNSGTGTFIKGPNKILKVSKVYLGNCRLPIGYREVEYIQSSGTQYIDTGYIPTNNTKVELKMGGWTGFGSYPNLFGARLEWSTTGRGFQLGKTTTGSGDYFAMFGGYLTGLSPSTFSFGDGNDHIIEMSQSGIYEDGTLKQSLSSATFTSPTNMVIFADNENGTVGENGAYKLYYCQIYNNGTLVRDFVPCYRKADDVIGLYDLVNDVFYTNSGTGTFTKGEDVKPYIQVRPKRDNWVLFDETYASQSTTGSGGVIASKNGTIIRPSFSFGGGNGNYGIGTQDGYEVFILSGTHNNLDVGISDATYSSLFGNYRKIKIIYDYFNMGSKPNRYTNQIIFGNNEHINATSGGISRGSSFVNTSFALNTAYSITEIIDTSNMSTTATVTNLYTNVVTTDTFTKSFRKETNSTYIINGGGPVFFHSIRDGYGGPVVLGNVHIYVS